MSAPLCSQEIVEGENGGFNPTTQIWPFYFEVQVHWAVCVSRITEGAMKSHILLDEESIEAMT